MTFLLAALFSGGHRIYERAYFIKINFTVKVVVFSDTHTHFHNFVVIPSLWLMPRKAFDFQYFFCYCKSHRIYVFQSARVQCPNKQTNKHTLLARLVLLFLSLYPLAPLPLCYANIFYFVILAAIFHLAIYDFQFLTSSFAPSQFTFTLTESYLIYCSLHWTSIAHFFAFT